MFLIGSPRTDTTSDRAFRDLMKISLSFSFAISHLIFLLCKKKVHPLLSVIQAQRHVDFVLEFTVGISSIMFSHHDKQPSLSDL